jgi:hypothetical protein
MLVGQVTQKQRQTRWIARLERPLAERRGLDRNEASEGYGG